MTTVAFWLTLATAVAGMTGWAVQTRRLHAARLALAERDASAARAGRNAAKILRLVVNG